MIRSSDKGEHWDLKIDIESGVTEMPIRRDIRLGRLEEDIQSLSDPCQCRSSFFKSPPDFEQHQLLPQIN
jgi:hypothetical protein